MNMLFKIKYVSKRRRWYRKLHKAVIIPIDIHERNKKFTVIVQPKNACKLEFVDHLWLPFIDQSQSDILVFSVIFFRYITL